MPGRWWHSGVYPVPGDWGSGWKGTSFNWTLKCSGFAFLPPRPGPVNCHPQISIVQHFFIERWRAIWRSSWNHGSCLSSIGQSWLEGSFFQVQLVHKLCLFLDWVPLLAITHTLIISWLDYWNVLYLGLSLKTTWNLQLNLHVVTYCSGHFMFFPCYIAAVWLLFAFQVQFKVLVFTVKVLNGTRPGYLQDCFSLRLTIHPVRVGTFQVPSFKYCHLMQPRRCTLSMAILTLWNSVSLIFGGLPPY